MPSWLMLWCSKGKARLGCLLLEAEQPHRDYKADQPVCKQTKNIRSHLSEIFTQDHHTVQAFHSPCCNTNFSNLLHPYRLYEKRPPRATYCRREYYYQGYYGAKLTTGLDC